MHILSRQHAYLASQPCTHYQGNILTRLLSHAHTIKATYLPGFSAMHTLSRQHTYPASQPCTHYQGNILNRLLSQRQLTVDKGMLGSWLKVVYFLDHLSDIKKFPTDTKLKVACTEEHSGLVNRCTQPQSSGTKMKINIRKL